MAIYVFLGVSDFFFLFSKKIGIIFKKESKFDIFFLIFGKKESSNF